MRALRICLLSLFLLTPHAFAEMPPSNSLTWNEVGHPTTPAESTPPAKPQAIETGALKQG